MTGNRSTAVMQRRAVAPDALDYFPTPPWATRALCEILSGWMDIGIDIGENLGRQSAWEPCCGEMFMAKPMREYFKSVRVSDVHRYTPDHDLVDFMGMDALTLPRVDWIFMNPPFIHAEEFIRRALSRCTRGVAALVRCAFTESETRYSSLFGTDILPAWEFQFAERVVMLRGRLVKANQLDPFNLDPKTGAPRKASTATSYSWLVWMPGQHDWRKRIIPPCRLRMESEGDYPLYKEQWRAVGRNEEALRWKKGALL
jgi:hypothetical protein